MGLRLDIAPGSEWLLPFAKKKLRDLKDEMKRLGLPLLSKCVMGIGTDEKIFLQSQFVGLGQYLDTIRITAAGVIAWSYRAGSGGGDSGLPLVPPRMFLVDANGNGKALKAATNEPAGMLDTAGVFRAWNNFPVDYLVSANQKRYLAEGDQAVTPSKMNFVYDNQYLGAAEWDTANADLNWFLNRAGDCWASSSSYDNALTSEPTRLHIDVYAPRLPTPENATYGFYTTRYNWDDFFAPYLAEGAGLSVWVSQSTYYLLAGWGDWYIPLYVIDGADADGLRQKNIVTFSWAYVTGASPIPVGAADWEVYMTQRVVTAVLDTKATASVLSDLPIDPATGRPALGRFRVLADDTYDYTLHNYYSGFNTFKITGRFNEHAPSGTSTFGTPDFGAVVTAKGKVIHRKNIYAVIDYNDTDTPENKTLESAKIFVDGVEVYSCTDYPIIVRDSSPVAATFWVDIYPVDNDAGLAFVFVKIIPVTAGVPGDGFRYHYYLYQNGAIVDTELEVNDSTVEGAQHVVLLNDGEHIIFWNNTVSSAHQELRIWRKGFGIVYYHDPVVAASQVEHAVEIAAAQAAYSDAFDAAVAAYFAGTLTSDQAIAAIAVAQVALDAVLALATPDLAPPLQYQNPIKDVIDHLTFYADGYACKVKWTEDAAGNRTYSLGITAFPGKGLSDEAGNIYASTNQIYIPFSAVPK